MIFANTHAKVYLKEMIKAVVQASSLKIRLEIFELENFMENIQSRSRLWSEPAIDDC